MAANFLTKISNAFSWIKIYNISLIKISLTLKGPIHNIPALVQIMAWHRPGDKPLSERMMFSSMTHICVIWSQWVNSWFLHTPRAVVMIYVMHMSIKQFGKNNFDLLRGEYLVWEKRVRNDGPSEAEQLAALLDTSLLYVGLDQSTIKACRNAEWLIEFVLPKKKKQKRSMAYHLVLDNHVGHCKLLEIAVFNILLYWNTI